MNRDFLLLRVTRVRILPVRFFGRERRVVGQESTGPAHQRCWPWEVNCFLSTRIQVGQGGVMRHVSCLRTGTAQLRMLRRARITHANLWKSRRTRPVGVSRQGWRPGYWPGPRSALSLPPLAGARGGAVPPQSEVFAGRPHAAHRAGPAVMPDVLHRASILGSGTITRGLEQDAWDSLAGFPIKNVGNDKEGTPGMTGGNAGNDREGTPGVTGRERRE